MNTPDTITLRRWGGSWMATYSGSHAAQVRDLFGTTTIPTAFGTGTPGPEVAAHIRHLNPFTAVILPECDK